MNQFACARGGNLALDLLPTAMQKLKVGFKVKAVLESAAVRTINPAWVGRSFRAVSNA